MLRINLSKTGNSPFQQLIGHNPQILKQWTLLEKSVIEDSSLGEELLEQVRRTLAFGNKCEYCMVKAGKPDFNKGNTRVGLARAFAELYVLDHKEINESQFNVMKEEFSDLEISELCSFISFITASQSLGRIFNLTEDYQKEKITTMQRLLESNSTI